MYQYFGNDIEGEAYEHGLKTEAMIPYSDLSFFGRSLVRSSFIANHIYWSLPNLSLNKNYFQLIKSAYNSDEILAAHFYNLELIIEHCAKNEIQLVIIVVPFLNDLEASDRLYFQKIMPWLQSLQSDQSGFSILDVSLLVENLPKKQRIVSRYDSHASKKVNRLIADELINIIDDCE